MPDTDKIRIAVVGEGPTDYGTEVYGGKGKQYIWEEGPIFPLIKHTAELLERPVVVEAVDKHEVLRIKRQRFHKETSGLEGKANDSMRFSVYMNMHGYSHGIFYCDADKFSGEKNGEEHICKKWFEKVYAEVIAGIEATAIPDQKIIPMIPMKMIECWLLADEKAYLKVFGLKTPELPSAPELIWGNKSDPKSDYPKCYLARVLKKIKGKAVKTDRETFYKIAHETSIEMLRKRCPISFERFYEDFEQKMV